MAEGIAAVRRRAEGSIETLPSGALRVKVYAGSDSLSGRRLYLTETVKPGPGAKRTAEATRRRLLNEVAERRNPRTKATVDQLLERYLEQFDGAPNTLTLYRGYVRNHISPYLGHLKVGQVDADILDSFYAELRRCRTHCNRQRQLDHRTPRPHECDERCRQHACRPLGRTTVRHMHFVLSGAYKKAVRWRWVSVSPIGQAEPPAAPMPNPEPPTPAEAAQILNEAWRDPAWGALLWVAMTTGARRGELCAVRRSSVNLDRGRETVWLRRAVRKDDGGKLVEAELKTHQQRRIALDPETVAILRAHLDRQDADAVKLGIALASDAFVFSETPDGCSFLKPDSVTQRYDRLAERLGILTTLHKLRHFSATELIAAGVDVRTVAGRLGHAGGGTTTLRTYSAWVSEADQRAATGLGSRMPPRPIELAKAQQARRQPRHPYEVVAAAVADRIERGELAPGALAPIASELCALHGVALATARRAVALLKDWGLLVGTGGRPRVARPDLVPLSTPFESNPTTDSETAGVGYWSVTLVGPGGFRCTPRLVPGDLTDPESFRPHMIGIAAMELPAEFTRDGPACIAGYELEVRKPTSTNLVTVLRLS